MVTPEMLPRYECRCGQRWIPRQEGRCSTACSDAPPQRRATLKWGIPPELSNLANLPRLWLVRGQLRGEIPPDLGNSANLRFLTPTGTQLSGANQYSGSRNHND